MDLEGFVKARPVRANPGQAWCCTLPEAIREQIEDAVDNKGVRNWRAISEWLQREGYADATPSRVQYHFDRKHTRVGAA